MRNAEAIERLGMRVVVTLNCEDANIHAPEPHCSQGSTLINTDKTLART
jgi:cytosine/adenosine deaminase-related metal-dependent hydrolase